MIPPGNGRSHVDLGQQHPSALFQPQAELLQVAWLPRKAVAAAGHKYAAVGDGVEQLQQRVLPNIDTRYWGVGVLRYGAQVPIQQGAHELPLLFQAPIVAGPCGCRPRHRALGHTKGRLGRWLWVLLFRRW